LGFSGVPAALTDNDGFLGYVLGTSQTVGARYFYWYGILRQTPLLIAFQDRLYPHLSLATLMKAEGISDTTIESDRYGLLIKAGKHRIPVTQEGFFRLRSNGPAQRHRYIAGVDLLNGDFAPSDIEGKIVFIGSSAVGLNDLHHTVFDTQFPGIEVHAVIVETTLQQQHIITPHRCCSSGFISQPGSSLSDCSAFPVNKADRGDTKSVHIPLMIAG
jgi:hypothetical protein